MSLTRDEEEAWRPWHSNCEVCRGGIARPQASETIRIVARYYDGEVNYVLYAHTQCAELENEENQSSGYANRWGNE
jgi:hypothetical protein